MQLAKAEEDMLAQTEAQNAIAKELAKTRRELSVANESSELAKRTRKVLNAWAEAHPNANTDLNGARAKTVRAALRLGHTNPPLRCPVHDAEGKPDKGAECTVVDELLEALEGLRLLPFVGPKGRTAGLEPGCRRYDDVEHALRDEATIERFRGYARRARMSRVERLRAAVEAAQNVENAWFGLWVEALSLNGHRNGDTHE